MSAASICEAACRIYSRLWSRAADSRSIAGGIVQRWKDHFVSGPLADITCTNWLMNFCIAGIAAECYFAANGETEAEARPLLFSCFVTLPSGSETRELAQQTITRAGAISIE